MKTFILTMISTFLFSQNDVIKIGSKSFNESYILAEITAQLLEYHGYSVERKHGLGGALIAYEALKSAEIDFYPDYSGTVMEAILKAKNLSISEMNERLAEFDIEIRPGYGFNNTYAIVIDGKIARSRSIQTLSDLKLHPDLKLGFSNEFLNRQDGWPNLSKHYDLENEVVGLEHALAYNAIKNGGIIGTDAYSTDGDLANYDLVSLADDLAFFPEYDAFPLIRKSLASSIKDILNRLNGQIDEALMQKLNKQVMVDKMPFEKVASDFLKSIGIVAEESTSESQESKIMKHTLDHLALTFLAVFLGCIVALPLSFLAYRHVRISKSLIYLTGLFQTIPSLALLALMIPIFGLGFIPAIIALFLYSLLPIVRNTIIGIQNVDPLLKDVAKGMGLTAKEQLIKIEIPLAFPMILAGIKTATIISIGTATLAAFVGGGGLGEPILTGLTLNDMDMILSGALPAAGLAILVELLFELIERKINL